VRNFDPAYVSNGSKARITAPQHCCPLHLLKMEMLVSLPQAKLKLLSALALIAVLETG
jgi:hypothetical protein